MGSSQVCLVGITCLCVYVCKTKSTLCSFVYSMYAKHLELGRLRLQINPPWMCMACKLMADQASSDFILFNSICYSELLYWWGLLFWLKQIQYSVHWIPDEKTGYQKQYTWQKADTCIVVGCAPAVGVSSLRLHQHQPSWLLVRAWLHWWVLHAESYMVELQSLHLNLTQFPSLLNSVTQSAHCRLTGIKILFVWLPTCCWGTAPLQSFDIQGINKAL